MPTDNCRVCHNRFFMEPLLRYDNMPRVAQFLPGASSLECDKGIDLEICQCSGCGLVQLSNDPVHYHKDVIRAAAFSEEMKDFRKKQFDEFTKIFSLAGKKVIEIGCGRGEFLSIMRESIMDAYGVEHSEESVAQCVKNGLKVSKGFMKSDMDALSDAPFDAFFMLNFLEHLPDPNSVLRGIYENLSENAVGLVEVPNFDMILRNKLFSEFTSDHLFYFTRETFCSALRINGFDIVECNEVWHEYIISAFVRKRGRLDIDHFYKYQAKLKLEIEEYIGRFKENKVAIWGAGHQALAIISMMDLAGRIKYVVDSATFKQGKYTPATHIRIVSPDALVADPVDGVIVMAASYSDEVARTIKNKFGEKPKVSILRDFGLEIK